MAYKVGVFGANVRARWLAQEFMFLNCEIVAVCETRDTNNEEIQNTLNAVGKDTPVFTDFDEFLKVDMDICLLVNFFHEHAPYAIKCLNKGIHVISECISNGTMAEGVELFEAASKSKAIYFLSENYPQMAMNLEMQKICNDGTLGKIVYAEGEYNHPGDPKDSSFQKSYTYFPHHWRNYLPKTYYITHSLGPLMRATNSVPLKVTAFNSCVPKDTSLPSGSFVQDYSANITTLNNDGSIYRVTACSAFGGHHNSYRICGTKGSIENFRATNQIRLHYNPWNKPEDRVNFKIYETPLTEDFLYIKEANHESGHDGADYVTIKMFLECVKNNTQPPYPFDIFGATTMSSVAILAHRSALEGGKPFDVPDFRDEKCRDAYRNDRLSPFYLSDGTPPSMPCSTHDTNYKPTEEQIQKYLDLLK